MEYDNKTIMILGAGQLQVPILQRAIEKGLRVVVVSPSLEQPGIKYADAVVQLDVKDEKGILDAAREYHIDGITTDQTDLPVRTAAFVAEQMGLPGIGYDMGCLFTDKYRQRSKCQELGLFTPKFLKVHTAEEAMDFYKTCRSEIIMKPVDSQASHGVTKISREDQIMEAFCDAKEYSRTGEVIVEEFIEGTEFPVDSYVENGECKLLAIGQYHPFEIDGVFSSYNTLYPAKQEKDVIDLLTRTNKLLVEGFGLKNGRTHGEYIVSNGRVALVEIGARGGGSFFSSNNVRYISGFSTEDYLIDTALGITRDTWFISDERHKVSCTLFFYLPECGVVEKTDGIRDVLSLEYIRRNNLDQIYCGLETHPVVDKGARYFMIVVAESYEQLEERIKYIRKTLKIETRTNNGELRLPIWK